MDIYLYGKSGQKMNSDFDKHQRRSIRLPGYDYAHTGLYFVTICTRNRSCLFGDIENGVMKLSVAGKMVKKCWLELPGRFTNIELDEFVVMPNHFHGIITIVSDPNVGAPLVGARFGGARFGGARFGDTQIGDTQIGDTQIGDACKKTPVNRAPTRGAPTGKTDDSNISNGWTDIIRNEMEFIRVQQYIIHNPLQCELDRENPCPKNEIKGRFAGLKFFTRVSWFDMFFCF